MSILIMARNLGKAIQEQPEYMALEAARKANDEDPELQKLVEQFNLMSVSMEHEAGAENPDEQKMDKINADMLKLYTTIMENKNMVEFNKAKQTIDKQMDDIVAILAAAVNGEDPMQFELKHDDGHSCGGDCSCCHGC